LGASATTESVIHAQPAEHSTAANRQHLNDDLQIVTLSPSLISAPPIDLWPRIIRRGTVPADIEALLAELESDETLGERNQAAAHDAN
jgi:hypothetical protein